jgi:Right handed beta helix region
MRRVCVSGAVLVLAVVVPPSALSHVERSSYWPDPRPDTGVRPAAGGKVPAARSLTSALNRRARGNTRVVCKKDSLRRAYRSIRLARRSGYIVRPSQPRRRLTRAQARRQRRINRRLFKRCRFRHIQTAVFRSKNNDRVVVMPGRYFEDPSRRAPTNDPKCEQYEERSENGEGAATYRYQANCPNDQSLIYVQGRALTDKEVPMPPRENRHGIPDEGHCVRCNLQIEGSGVTGGDVLIDAAKNRRRKLREPGGPVKDVVLRADRADGIVIKKITAAHAAEHGIYVHETDGYLLDQIKVFYNEEYGTLTFTSDHGLTRDCEAMGHGDAGLYPGAAVDTGEQTPEDRPRQNQAITRCDSYHNNIGYSGTMGNATHVFNNEFWDNATAITTDSFFAGGHPGYPQDSAIFENNRIYDNNFNTFKPGSDVVPKVPVPVGTGILIAGGNNNVVRGNRIWDNWRRGVMLISVPDVLSGETGAFSTSHRNSFVNNVMGLDPTGTRMHNGVDFWWDEHPNQEDNCWRDNGDVTSDPPPPVMPSNCDNTSVGATYGTKLPELAGCAGSIATGDFNPDACPWFQDPPRPGDTRPSNPSASAGRAGAARFAELVGGMCDLLGSSLSCDPFRGQRP